MWIRWVPRTLSKSVAPNQSSLIRFNSIRLWDDGRWACDFSVKVLRLSVSTSSATCWGYCTLFVTWLKLREKLWSCIQIHSVVREMDSNLHQVWTRTLCFRKLILNIFKKLVPHCSKLIVLHSQGCKSVCEIQEIILKVETAKKTFKYEVLDPGDGLCDLE